jgi:protein-serine/threonine kinase
MDSLCKSAIKKLLIKDEHKRLGSNSGASEVKAHKWFTSVNWGLLRHMTPPVCPSSITLWSLNPKLRRERRTKANNTQIIPAESNGIDAINFRAMRDSKSVDLERGDDIIHASAVLSTESLTPGIQTPKELTGGLPSPEPTSGSRSRSASRGKEEVNPFGNFSSVTRDIGEY